MLKYELLQKQQGRSLGFRTAEAGASAEQGTNPHIGLGAWTNGHVYSAPIWLGIRTGNRIERIGYSFPGSQDLQQNGMHRGFGNQNYYLNYDNFRTGMYLRSAYYNPFSLWGY